MKTNKGVKKGYTHNWTYRGAWHEVKTGPGKWKVSFKATKHRGGSSKGGPAIGSKIVWEIKGKQTAIKTGPKKYQTHLTATKKLISIKPPKRKKR